MKYTIDAKGKKLGRLSTEVAVLLMGKNTVDFKKNIASGVEVDVINAKELVLDPKKLKDKEYKSYSGYPGGLKKNSMEDRIEKRGMEFIIKKAVRGMLPNNKLRPKRLKLLNIYE